MLNLKLNLSTTNELISVSVPTTWHDVSVLQFAQIQGEDIMGQIAVLLGLEVEQVRQIEFNSFDVLLDAMAFLHGPLPDVDESSFPENIGRESIGQLELAKKFVLALEGYNIWHMAPYIYAIYMCTDKYDIEAAFASLSGFPTALVLEAQKVPITQMYNAILFFSMNCSGFATVLLLYWTANPTQRKKWPALTASRSMASSPPS